MFLHVFRLAFSLPDVFGHMVSGFIFELGLNLKTNLRIKLKHTVAYPDSTRSLQLQGVC